MGDSQSSNILDPILRKSVESGLISTNAISETRFPETAVMESVNFDFDRIGSATIRKGTTILGNALGGTVLGLYQFIDTVSTPAKSQLIMVNGTSAYYLSGASWASIRTGLTSGSKARFSTFLNNVFMVNGTEATVVWDGTAPGSGGSFVATGNAASAPIGKYIENYRSRMWIAGNSSKPDRVYYSSVPTSVTTPIITWNTSDTTGQWIDISPSDGETINGLHRSKSSLFVFKTNHIYKIYSINQTDPDPRYDVGTYSQESIVESKTGVYFHHSSGFYQLNGYGVLQEISKPIIDIVRAIPATSYGSVVGWLEPDGDHICWEIGTVTVGSTTYTNCVLRYTISTQVWTHRVYPTQFTATARYTDGTTLFALAADTAGAVLQMNTGMTDNGLPINYSLIHRWDYLDGFISTRKTIQFGAFIYLGGAGTNIQYQVEGDPDQDWSKVIGQLDIIDSIFTTLGIKARKVRIRISGNSTGQPFSYSGYEFIDVASEIMQSLT